MDHDEDKDPHISFPAEAEEYGFPLEIWADADLRIVSWTFDLPLIDTDLTKVLVPPSETAYVQSAEVIHNNGPFGPTVVINGENAGRGEPSP